MRRLSDLRQLGWADVDMMDDVKRSTFRVCLDLTLNLSL